MISVSILGCGALGSRIAKDVGLHDRELILYDNDRVGDENIGTSAFSRYDVGKLKVSALASIIRSQYKTTESGDITRLGELTGTDLYIDALDNAKARNHLSEILNHDQDKLLHVGVGEGVGEIIWGAFEYVDRPDNPVCTHQLGIPLISLTAAVGVVAIEEYIATGTRYNYIVNAIGEVRRV